MNPDRARHCSEKKNKMPMYDCCCCCCCCPAHATRFEDKTTRGCLRGHNYTVYTILPIDVPQVSPEFHHSVGTGQMDGNEGVRERSSGAEKGGHKPCLSREKTVGQHKKKGNSVDSGRRGQEIQHGKENKSDNR